MRLKPFWILMCLTCLGACSTGAPVKTITVVQSRVEVAAPPQELLRPCEEPVLPRVATVRDVLEHALSWRVAYAHCAAQVRCLAAWTQAASREQAWQPDGCGALEPE
ncbi:Rz1-like lysis system protein LysC [Xylella taiwanensis]|uniref:Rz1-like lysis system protein LysC n=2 Tax=Xylella taiwanensis TaxID=1444770 RepID=UPI003CCEAC67